jgi:uncharacterized cupin superfamily protein
MTIEIRRITDAGAVAESYRLAADKLVEGNPLQTVRMHYTDATNRFFTGTWHSEPGKWRVVYTEEEYCEMIEGSSVITDEAGNAVTVVAGDRFVVPRGFVGTWEVVAPTTKRFVIFDSGESLDT